jgi:hypothetical protein
MIMRQIDKDVLDVLINGWRFRKGESNGRAIEARMHGH